MKYILIYFIAFLSSCNNIDIVPNYLSDNYCYNDVQSPNISNFKLPTLSKFQNCGDPVNPPSFHFKDSVGLNSIAFNPNNGNELVFAKTKYNSVSETYELAKYNFCTGFQCILLNEYVRDINLNVNEWAAFVKKDRQVWKMKLTGDSLMPVTNIGLYNNYPSWNKSGDRLCFQREMSQEYNIFIANDKGGIVDTLPVIISPIRKYADFKNDKVIYVRKNSSPNAIDSIYCYNLNTNENKLLNISAPETYKSIYLAKWLVADSVLVWSTENFLAITDINSLNTEVLLLFSDNFKGISFDCSPDKKTIATLIIESQQISPCKIEGESYIVLSNINTKQLFKLKIK